MKNHMIKRFGVLLGLLALLALMTACGGGQYDPNNGNSTGNNNTENSTPGSTPGGNNNANNGYYTLKLYGNSGNITVQTGNVTTPTVTASGKKVTVQTDTANKLYTVKDSDVANASVEVVVPTHINLDLLEKNGNITVTGVYGQEVLQTTNGTINVTHATLTDSSSAKTGKGELSFNASLAPDSTTMLTTTEGTIDFILPADAKFHVEATATAGNGRIASDFVTVKDPKNVNENVGGASSPVLKLTTSAGFINFHKAH